ncbi:MAG: hypothetical protein QOE99_3222 [Actinomycetota bacterium]|nr:hypothetical protein [Actinomycetota bacterium]
MDLISQVLLLHASLDAAGVPHAFGGALALAYWTAEPRGTRDIDCNVFVSATLSEGVLAALPSGVDVPPGTAGVIAKAGQVRLWWGETPLDLFFDYAPLHKAAAAGARRVPLAGTDIPVLGPVELVLFKALFDRTKDWADVEAVLAAGSTSAAEVEPALAALVGADDPRLARLAEAARRAH